MDSFVTKELGIVNLRRSILSFKYPVRCEFRTRLSKVENYRSQLHYLSFKYGLLPMPLSKINNSKIDMLWLEKAKNETKPTVAFELNNSLTVKSIKKLNYLTEVPLRILVSYSNRITDFNKSLEAIKELKINRPIYIIAPQLSECFDLNPNI